MWTLVTRELQDTCGVHILQLLRNSNYGYALTQAIYVPTHSLSSSGYVFSYTNHAPGKG